MKKAFGLIFIIVSLNAWSGSGMVTTTRAHFLSEESDGGVLLQIAKQGDIIYINDRYFQKEAEEKEATESLYYQTITRDGQIAWVSKSEVKLIYNDQRELSDNINRYPNQKDITYWSILDPLPEDFPFTGGNKNHASIIWNIGPKGNKNYNYNSNIDKVGSDRSLGWSIIYSRRVDWNKENRFYFGTLIQYHNSISEFTTYDLRKTKEIGTSIGAGPYLSYDVFKSKDYLFTLSGGIAVNYLRYFVSQRTESNLFEERKFSGFSITPQIAPFISFKNVFKQTDAVVGMRVHLTLKHALKPNTNIALPDLWQKGSRDVINIQSGVNGSIFFGVRYFY